MEIDSKLLVQALKKAGEDRGLTQEELGEQLGFSKDRAKNIFTSRTKLSGDDVLRILSDPQYSLSKLKRYAPYWSLRRDFADVEREFQIMDAVNESALMFSRRIQSSLMQTDKHKSSSEMARDVMSDKRWWVLQTGWICSAVIDGETIVFTPVVPDFLTAINAMKHMGWIKYNKEMKTAWADWGRINGGKTGLEANAYCEKALRDYVINPDNGFDLDPQFQQVIEDRSANAIKIDRVNRLSQLIDIVLDVAPRWMSYSLPTQMNEYGFSPALMYRNGFDYLESSVLEMDAIHHELVEEDIPIDEDIERAYRHILSLNGEQYRYSTVIDIILAVNDRAGRLANPTGKDWKRYLALKEH